MVVQTKPSGEAEEVISAGPSSIVSLVLLPVTQFAPACFWALVSQINSFAPDLLESIATRHDEPTLLSTGDAI